MAYSSSTRGTVIFFDTRLIGKISASSSISCGNFEFLCNRKKKKGKRWVQTFLVVKGRNLQLSNKSLRLNPFCDWLQRATWHTLYEHELYAVVYSLVLPLYQQQTKAGARNVFPPLYSNIKTLHSRFGAALCVIFIRSPTSWQRDLLDSRRLYQPLSACIPPGGNKAATGKGNGASKPARKYFPRQVGSLPPNTLLIAEMGRQPTVHGECARCWYFPLASWPPQLLYWTTAKLQTEETLLG